MRVIGIDPGTARLGYAVLDFNNNNSLPVIIDCGIISTNKSYSDAQRLMEIRADLLLILDKHKPQFASIEKLFFFKNLKTIIPVAQARGVCLELLVNQGLEVCEYTPLEMKKNITGNGMAKKDFVSKVIHEYLGLKQAIKPDDAVDAIGLALCFIRSNVINNKKS
jgi:crossover junction endodeoxyribonuclease RuvC